MRIFLLVLIVCLVTLFAGWYFLFQNSQLINPLSNTAVSPTPKPLEKYTFEQLRKSSLPSESIRLGRLLKEDTLYKSQLYYSQDHGKKVSGLINMPTQEGEYPVIIMFRGFIPKEEYSTGIGTKRAGEVFAANGFITLAPDFLGYGESDNPSTDSIEERFQTYTTALSLVGSVEKLQEGLDASYSGKIRIDTSRVGIWGHSNGGHIALSTLTIIGKQYPTVLWAPVSKPFPYSILYFTDEFEDHGKALRKAVAHFEKDYDIERYSPANYYEWISAPLQIHQGIDDDAVPLRWSDQLVEELKNLKKDVTYFIYANSDHNLSPDGWNTAVQRSIDFYRNHFSKQYDL